jgi:hypothetical protein
MLVGVSVGPVQGCFDAEEEEEEDGSSSEDEGDEDGDVEEAGDTYADVEDESPNVSGEQTEGTATRSARSAKPAAPKKGKERRVEGRRWRLMMLYQDMTVLSYEIGRSRSKGETPGLAELVV